MKKWIIGIVALGLLAALGGFVYMEAVKRNIIRINEYDIRSEGLLQVGDLAPDVELLTMDPDERLTLSQLYADKPLVLAFGSYT